MEGGQRLTAQAVVWLSGLRLAAARRQTSWREGRCIEDAEARGARRFPLPISIQHQYSVLEAHCRSFPIACIAGRAPPQLSAVRIKMMQQPPGSGANKSMMTVPMLFRTPSTSQVALQNMDWSREQQQQQQNLGWMEDPSGRIGPSANPSATSIMMGIDGSKTDQAAGPCSSPGSIWQCSGFGTACFRSLLSPTGSKLTKGLQSLNSILDDPTSTWRPPTTFRLDPGTTFPFVSVFCGSQASLSSCWPSLCLKTLRLEIAPSVSTDTGPEGRSFEQ
jgi:hypothetical protein